MLSARVAIPFLVLACDALAQEAPEPRFGTTVFASAGFQGKIYTLPAGTKSLPDFKKLAPIGTIYAASLNIPPQNFDQGFPGVTNRFEWFAIDYTGHFWIDKPGRYTFSLISDDGSKLYVDGKVVVNNDGIHPPMEITGHAKLKDGIHEIRVSYFQGPPQFVALVLLVAAPYEELHVFRADDFRPPQDWVDPRQPRQGPK